VSKIAKSDEYKEAFGNILEHIEQEGSEGRVCRWLSMEEGESLGEYEARCERYEEGFSDAYNLILKHLNSLK
jgi:hypothetical protein